MDNPFIPNIPNPYLWLANSDAGKRYREIVAGLRSATVKFEEDSEKVETAAPQNIEADVQLSDANGIGSEVVTRPGQHKVVLDIDHDALLVPSSTPGHHHLYINKSMSWDMYQEVLKVLASAGIIQKNYMYASIKRGGSWVRTPWTRKR
jgi:hypothetical protein